MANQPHHRKTIQHFNMPSHAHELTFTCYKGRPFLSKERTCNYLAEAIEKAREKHGFHLWAYVFMPNHVHLLIWPSRNDYSTADILLSIKQPVARRAVLYLKKYKPESLALLATNQKKTPYRFWQNGPGYDRNLSNPKAIHASCYYIHFNPVRKQLADYPEDWKWSSAKEWRTGEAGVLRLDMDSFPIL